VDAESGRKRKLDAIFHGGVGSMEFSSCGCYLVACSNSSREVLLFDVQASATTSEPIATFPVSGVPARLQCLSGVGSDSEEISLTMFVCFESSDGCILRYSPSSDNDNEANHNGKRKASSGPTYETCAILSYNSQLLALCIGKIGELSENGVSLAVGSLSNPQFLCHEYISPDGSELLAEISAKPSSQGEKENGNSKTKQDGIVAAPMVLGPLEAGPVKKPKVDGDISKYLAPNGHSSAGPFAPVDELTLEQRLEILSSTIVAEEESLTNKPPNSAMAKPTSDSLVTLIDQALQLNDDILLEECLGCEEVAVVDATVMRLSAHRIVPFLKKLVAKFEKRPSRSALLTHWLSSILRMHSSFLMSCPDLATQLAGLSQILDQRLLSYSKLATLGGRLDLLMTQVTSNSVTAANSRVDEVKRVPKVVYKDI
jgi:hypothetical protein